MTAKRQYIASAPLVLQCRVMVLFAIELTTVHSNKVMCSSGMQLKVWLVRKHPSRLGMQLKHPVYKKLCNTLT